MCWKRRGVRGLELLVCWASRAERLSDGRRLTGVARLSAGRGVLVACATWLRRVERVSIAGGWARGASARASRGAAGSGLLGRALEGEGERVVGVLGRLGCGERAQEKSGIGESDDGLASGLDWVRLGFGLGFLVLVFLSIPPFLILILFLTQTKIIQINLNSNSNQTTKEKMLQHECNNNV